MSDNLTTAFNKVNAALQKMREAKEQLEKMMPSDSTKVVGYVVRYQETWSDSFGGNQLHGNESDLAIFLVSSQTRKDEALRLSINFATEAAKRYGDDIEVFTKSGVDELNGVFCAIYDAKGCEPQFISWVVFPLLKIDFIQQPATP